MKTKSKVKPIISGANITSDNEESPSPMSFARHTEETSGSKISNEFEVTPAEAPEIASPVLSDELVFTANHSGEDLPIPSNLQEDFTPVDHKKKSKKIETKKDPVSVPPSSFPVSRRPVSSINNSENQANRTHQQSRPVRASTSLAGDENVPDAEKTSPPPATNGTSPWWNNTRDSGVAMASRKFLIFLFRSNKNSDVSLATATSRESANSSSASSTTSNSGQRPNCQVSCETSPVSIASNRPKNRPPHQKTMKNDAMESTRPTSSYSASLRQQLQSQAIEVPPTHQQSSASSLSFQAISNAEPQSLSMPSFDNVNTTSYNTKIPASITFGFPAEEPSSNMVCSIVVILCLLKLYITVFTLAHIGGT